MNDNHKLEESSLVCTYCNLPPKAGKKLRKCSRCQNAWYHDIDCQKRHFKIHKKICCNEKSSLKSKSEEQSTTNYNNVSFSIEDRVGRGKSLVASSLIKKGTRISNSQPSGWTPIIPPVLHEDHRTTRCALCFNPLTDQIHFCQNIPSNPLYKLAFCSTRCRDVGTNQFALDDEEQSISNLCRQNGPPKIFSTAILLYRILLAEKKNSDIKHQMEQLQSKPARDDSSHHFIEEDYEDESSQRHTQGVIATVMGMIQYSQQPIDVPSVEYLEDMVQRIKLNGFSICDSEFVCYGVGIYHPANFMNHSCQPNALQVFLFQQSQPPSLFVTAFQDIQANQEICISYIDTSCPTHIRRKQLQRDYYFHCTCDLCCNIQDDTIKMGITCPDCKVSSSSSSSSSQFVVTRAANVSIMPLPPNNTLQQQRYHHYKCDQCGRTDFDSTWKLLDRVEEQQEQYT